jgi:hypothetical protein
MTRKKRKQPSPAATLGTAGRDKIMNRIVTLDANCATDTAGQPSIAFGRAGGIIKSANTDQGTALVGDLLSSQNCGNSRGVGAAAPTSISVSITLRSTYMVIYTEMRRHNKDYCLQNCINTYPKPTLRLSNSVCTLSKSDGGPIRNQYPPTRKQRPEKRQQKETRR